MQKAPQDGAMAAVFASEAQVQGALGAVRELVCVAGENGPSETVISGDHRAVASVLEGLAAAGIKSKPLTVSHAFHSPKMDGILDELEAAAGSVTLSAPRLRVISNLTGAVASASELTSPSYWRRHAREAVRFASGVKALAALGVDTVIEMGPQPTLTALGEKAAPGAAIRWIPSLRKGRSDAQQLASAQ
jgi:acyl transferase domain-containing protein